MTFERKLDEPVEQRRIRDPALGEQLRVHARRREAGDRVELVDDDLAAAVIAAALERGLILLKAGISGNCIRVLCPLTIEDAVLDEALATWEDALASVLA